MEVSVIVPVYNAEAHLESCIASLRAQTLEACEFIFVNDGSTDRAVSQIFGPRTSGFACFQKRISQSSREYQPLATMPWLEGRVPVR